MPVDDSRFDITLRDARLPLLRDRWFVAALTLFLLTIVGNAWTHNIWGMAASPLAFVFVAWWRQDLSRLAARGRRLKVGVRR